MDADDTRPRPAADAAECEGRTHALCNHEPPDFDSEVEREAYARGQERGIAEWVSHLEGRGRSYRTRVRP